MIDRYSSGLLHQRGRPLRLAYGVHAWRLLCVHRVMNAALRAVHGLLPVVVARPRIPLTGVPSAEGNGHIIREGRPVSNHRRGVMRVVNDLLEVLHAHDVHGLFLNLSEVVQHVLTENRWRRVVQLALSLHGADLRAFHKGTAVSLLRVATERPQP